MKTIKMTKEQYLEKHKELVTLLGMDMIEKRISAEQDGLTVYQYGYIFALEKRITELEAMHDHQHLLDLADEMAKLQAENARLQKHLENSVSKFELDTCRQLNEALRQREDKMRKAMRNVGFVWSDDEFTTIEKETV